MLVSRFPSALVPRNVPAVLNAIAFLSLAALSSAAMPAVAVPPRPVAQVVVGGTLIHVIRTSWAGHSPQQRADEVQQRLIVAMAQGPVYAKDITVAKMQDDWCVLIRGQRLFTADGLAAKQQHSAPQTLANEWAVRLRQVLPDLTQPDRK